MGHSFFSQAFFYIVTALLAAFFGLLGILCILIPWSTQLRSDIVQFLLENSLTISIIGFGFLVIGVTMAVHLVLRAQKRSYHLHGSRPLVILDESLFQQYIGDYWKRVFPKYEVAHRLVLKKGGVHIVADLPFVPVQQQKLLLERIRSDLMDLFSRMLGYRGELFLSLSFQVSK